MDKQAKQEMEMITISKPPIELGPEEIPAPSPKVKPSGVEENTQNIDYGA
ncbi:hypothetical protein [Ammoniphilus sp. CFH 90114]|nr:hypothetical protein [Ammoniphilus sp. CFH 90114]